MNLGALWIALGTTLLCGLFAALQMALRGVSRAKAKRLLAESGGRRDIVAPILDDPTDYALAVAVPRVFFSLATVIAVVVLYSGFGPEADLEWPSLFFAAITSLALIYFGAYVAPASLSEHAAEALVIRLAWLIRLVHAVLLPVVRLSRGLDEAIRRLVGAEEQTEEEEIEEEIMSVVSESEDEGTLNESERGMIEAVMRLRGMTVSESMTPRTEIEGFELTDDLRFIKGFIKEAGHSRIPVYEGDLDHIAGVLYVKDLLDYLADDTSKFRLRPTLRECRFVPETKPALDLLSEFQREKVHMAIVLDEFGGTAGLVTIEDILEELVGPIQDEYEPEEESAPEVRVLAQERAAEMDARAYITDVNNEIEAIGLRIPEHDDYDTVGGFVLTSLGRIPEAGERFRGDGLEVLVLEAEPTRVTRVRVERSEEEEPAPSEAGAEEARGASK